MKISVRSGSCEQERKTGHPNRTGHRESTYLRGCEKPEKGRTSRLQRRQKIYFRGRAANTKQENQPQKIDEKINFFIDIKQGLQSNYGGHRSHSLI
jgi:hypothetical protein